MVVVYRWSHTSAGDHSKRADFPAPQHIRDDLGIAGVLNHADGKKYDSYSAYKKSVKAHGCEIVGDKPVTPFKPHAVPKAGGDIKAAIEQLKSR